MRTLVTGGNGFIGRHLVTELRSRGATVVVAGGERDGEAEITFDLRDAASIEAMVEAAAPDIVYHLAAQASVADAARAPIETYQTNVIGTAHLVETLRRNETSPRLVFMSSAEVYGAHVATELPASESSQLRPATVYAASKLAGEAIVLASVRSFGLRAIVVRPFNVIGPGQSDRFVVAAFAKRLAAIAAGGAPLFPVGNLEPQRDFIDVRDAVRAYADLGERGDAGEIYNVCSGTPISVKEILRRLVFAARVGVEIREDPALLRPVDVPLAYGDNAKLRARTGWMPQVALAHTLRDVYAAACGAQGVVGGHTANDTAHGG